MKINQAQFQHWNVIQWRSLTWAEYKKFQDAANFKGPMAVTNDIYRACIIQGPNVQDATAGLVEFVVQHIFKQSSFSGAYDILLPKILKARDDLNNDFLASARAVISSIFGYKFEEIDEWDEETFLMRLAQAEFVAGKPLPITKEEEEKIPTTSEKAEVKIRRKKELTPAQELVLERTRGK